MSGRDVAHVVTTLKEGTDGAVGSSGCSACGGMVDPDDRYCRHCGARFWRCGDGMRGQYARDARHPSEVLQG